MVTAAKTLSQVATHFVIAFSVMFVCTGSVLLGGFAALLEPLVNVALLPVHQHYWQRAQRRTARNLQWIQRASQFVLHLAVAFGLMFALSGSILWSGLAALLEPLLNVLLLPWHDQCWEKLRQQLSIKTTVPV